MQPRARCCTSGSMRSHIANASEDYEVQLEIPQRRQQRIAHVGYPDGIRASARSANARQFWS